MPRPSPAQRLVDVTEVATRMFGRLGYRRTQMAEVAAEVGIASGAIYTYVESKAALFHQVLATGFGQTGEILPALPLPTPAQGATLALARKGLGKVAATPRMRAALADPEPADVRAELTGIVEERYDMIERFWPALAVIQRSAADVPGLEELFFARSRHAHFNQLSLYLDRRAASGHLRVTPDAMLAGRIVSETIVWFAWHRHEDRDRTLYDDEAARSGVVRFIVDALVPQDCSDESSRRSDATFRQRR